MAEIVFKGTSAIMASVVNIVGGIIVLLAVFYHFLGNDNDTAATLDAITIPLAIVVLIVGWIISGILGLLFQIIEDVRPENRYRGPHPLYLHDTDDKDEPG